MRLLVLMFLVSCAQNQIKLKNDQVVPFSDFSKVSNVGNGLKTLAINSVIDNRDNKDQIGVALTGIKFSQTPVVVDTVVSEYMKGHFVKSLSQRGFSVNDMDGIKLDIVINELWVEELIEKYQPEKAKCKSNLTFYIKEGNKSWKGNYWTEIVSPGDLGDGTEKIAPTFASCLNEVVEKLVTDPSFINKLK